MKWFIRASWRGVEDVTQQVRIVESHGKKAAILQLLHEAGLLTPGGKFVASDIFGCHEK